MSVRNEEDTMGLEDLDVLVGTWRLTSSLVPEGQPEPRAETTFEWLEGRKFLVQRWHVDHPQAPDGIAIIGHGEDGTLAQHYFDSRGEARIYEMSLADGVWRLWRIAPGFSQRFAGTLDPDGDTIMGAWELRRNGSTWEHDFDLTYHRVR